MIVLGSTEEDLERLKTDSIRDFRKTMNGLRVSREIERGTDDRKDKTDQGKKGGLSTNLKQGFLKPPTLQFSGPATTSLSPTISLSKTPLSQTTTTTSIPSPRPSAPIFPLFNMSSNSSTSGLNRSLPKNPTEVSTTTLEPQKTSKRGPGRPSKVSKARAQILADAREAKKKREQDAQPSENGA